MEVINPVLWVFSNILVLTIFIAATAFVFLYPIMFKFEETAAGLLIWRTILSFALLAFLVVVGLFVDGRVNWWEMPSDIAVWRPGFRVVVFGFIAYTFGSLVWLIFVRRYWPHKVRKHPEGWEPPFRIEERRRSKGDEDPHA